MFLHIFLLSLLDLLLNQQRILIRARSQLRTRSIGVKNWPFESLFACVEILVLLQLHLKVDFHFIRQCVLPWSRLHPAALDHFFWVNMRAIDQSYLASAFDLLKMIRADGADTMTAQLFKLYLWGLDVFTPFIDWIGYWLEFFGVGLSFFCCDLSSGGHGWHLDLKWYFY